MGKLKVLCVVPNLNLEFDEFYLKLRKYFGDMITKDVSMRTLTIEFEKANVHFITKNMSYNSLAGQVLDIVFIMDDIPTDMFKEIKIRCLIHGGLIFKICKP